MNLDKSTDPLELFHSWLDLAQQSEINDPTAAALATVEGNLPYVRMVLVKKIDPEGFCFYTNLESVKGRNLKHNPNASLCFYWKSLERQVRIEGTTYAVEETDADAYFATRPRLSQLAAWASLQSRSLSDPKELEDRLAEQEQRWAGKDITRPPHWSGFCLKPQRFEFWQAGKGRLHKRFDFTRSESGWRFGYLYP